jgi:hypothetical protein
MEWAEKDIDYPSAVRLLILPFVTISRTIGWFCAVSRVLNRVEELENPLN